MEAAVAAHRDGRLVEAEAIYRRVLAEPKPPPRAALNLGAILLGRRAWAEAESCFAAVLRIQPDHPQAWDLWINALIGAGRFEDAERAVSGRGDGTGVAAEARLRRHWAAALGEQRLFEAAEAQLRRVCDLAGDADSHNDLGRLLLSARRPGEALLAFQAGLDIEPEHLPTLINQGSAYRLQGRHADAEAAYRRALALDPTNEAAVRNLVAHLNVQGQAEAARAVEDAAKALGADLGGSDLARGAVLLTSGRYEAATTAFELALSRGGDRYEALTQLGVAKAALGDHAAGLLSLDSAVGMAPDEPFARYRRAFVRLAIHDFEGGWPDYEHRWREQTFLEDSVGAPPAIRDRLKLSPRPQDLAGRRVLVIGEQGAGDQIMFASMLPDLARAAAAVSCRCDDRLVALFGHSFPGVDVGGSGAASAAARAADIIVPLGSLGHAYRNRLEDFPASSYLRPRDAVVARWAERLGPRRTHRRIGISWRGGTSRSRTHERSVPLERLGALLDLPDCEFVSLQYGDVEADLAAVNAGRANPVRHFPSADIDDFEDLAGLMANLDLVVSVQTALVHLAGALGVTALVMIPRRAEWRYGARGTTMPWYGSVRLFRQDQQGDWNPVIARIRDAILED